MQPIRTDEITGLWSYLKTIDWTEPWFAGLALFHVVCAITTFLTCRHHTLQGVVFALFLMLVGCSEYINQFAAQHWKKFSRQQYFDSNGLFISVVFSVPILINCLVIVVLWLKMSADLMRNIRRKQLQQGARKEGEATVDVDGDKGQTPSSCEVASGDSKKDN
ncbi:transmembrane protein 18-like [Babylonia areolata]|uniref:transmembrane protein 18-like n=1 Tax=Babylonia areolata TaxID=304850 RepID=UPI003FD3F4B9